jgi:hypothetical protein
MLISLAFLVGCRQREVLPEPPNDAIDSATLAKIQAWYNPKIARLRGAKSTGIDIYLPQWGDGKLHTLPNGEKVALFPVHREKNVQYFDIGFVRRFAVRLDAQDNIKGVKLVEMIGNKAYLRQNKDEVAKRYYFQNMQGTGSVAWEKDIRLTLDKAEFCNEEVVSVSINQNSCTVTIKTSCFGKISTATYMLTDCGSGGGSAGGSSGSGGWFPPNDGGGGNGGGNEYPVYDEDPPCTNCPVDSFDDPGDNTNPPQEPPNVSANLLALIDKNPYQSNIPNNSPVWQKVDSVLNEGIMQSAELRTLYDSLVAKGFNCSFDLMDTGGLGKFSPQYNNPGKKGIQLDVSLFQDDELKNWLKISLFAELTHGWQHMKYGDSTYATLRNNHRINLEAEQRFFLEYIEEKTKNTATGVGIFGMRKGYTFYDKPEYREPFKEWLQEIKTSPDGKPTQNNIQAKYFTLYTEQLFRQMWKNTSYTKNPTNFNFFPTAILSLF